MSFLSFAAFAQAQDEVRPEVSQAEMAKSVRIFPNPAVDFVHVRFDQLPARTLKVSVHNIIGNPVPVETEVTDEFEVRVRVKDLTSGYYLLAVKDEENRFQGTYKFLKR